MLDYHTHTDNSFCTLPAPFVMSRGRSKCPYHVKSSYLHQVNHNFIPYEKGREFIHSRISNQVLSSKRVYSNRLGISYNVDYKMNNNPNHVTQKGFHAYTKTFSQFSFYNEQSTKQFARYNCFMILYGGNKRNHPVSPSVRKTSKAIKHLYILTSSEDSGKKKNRNLILSNPFFTEVVLARSPLRGNKHNKCEYCRKLFWSSDYREHVSLCKDNPYRDLHY